MSFGISESDIAMEWSGIMKLLSSSFQTPPPTSSEVGGKGDVSHRLKDF